MGLEGHDHGSQIPVTMTGVQGLAHAQFEIQSAIMIRTYAGFVKKS